MTHIVLFSSGAGSAAAALAVADRHGTDDLRLVFTDTLYEDADNYRFLVDAACQILGGDSALARSIAEDCKSLPPTVSDEAIEERRRRLPSLAASSMDAIPGLVWIVEGRGLWEIAHDVRLIPNTRMDPCSRILKREAFRGWMEERYEPDECIAYLGLDWMEGDRIERFRRAFEPYRAVMPLADWEEYRAHKQQALDRLRSAGVRPPSMYREGWQHANCAGFCVKAGRGHFRNLLALRPDVYRYHEQKEQEMREYLDADVSILRDRKGGTTDPITMRDFRREVETEADDGQCSLFDESNWGGGCSCFLDPESK